MADADLLLAVINGRLPEVITALDAGVSPDLSYSTGTTLIESACLNAFPFGDDAGANEEIVRLLLRAGANPNPDSGTPPLLYSTMSGNASTTKMLLEAGADVQASSLRGWTPLHRACSSSAACVKLLLASGAGSVVNVQCQDGEDGELFYPLDLAVKGIVEHPPFHIRAPTRIERALPLLLRAGAICPTPYYSTLSYSDPYLDKVIAAGGFRRYEQRHINALAATFGPKLGLLPEIARVVVAFYAHCGFY